MKKEESSDMIKNEGRKDVTKEEESKDVRLIQKYVNGEIDLNKPYNAKNKTISNQE